MKLFRSTCIALLCIAALSQTQAKKNNPLIDLDFVPQQNVGGVAVRLDAAMRERPVEFRLTDDRRLDDPAEIGSRTDDDDRETTLTASSDVVEFTSGAISRVAGEWGLRLEEGADRILACRLVRFRVLESNQAVGATYESMVSLGCKLERADGTALLSISATGDATRYGKKFSNANCNEVLSDAILEALGSVLDNPDLQRAWKEPSAR